MRSLHLGSSCSSVPLTAVVDDFFFPIRHWRSIQRFDGGMTDGERKKNYMDAGDGQAEMEAHRHLPARLCFCPTNRWNCPPHTSPWSQFTGPSGPLRMGIEGALLPPIGPARFASLIRALPGKSTAVAAHQMVPYHFASFMLSFLSIARRPQSGGREDWRLLSTFQLELSIS